MTAEPGSAVPAKRYELWSLREDVSVELDSGDGPVRLRGRWGDVTVRQPSQLVREALRRMRLGPISLENVLSAPGRGETHAQRTGLHRVLERLQPLIIRSLGQESGQPLLSVVPLTMRSRFRPARLAAAVPVRLSAYAGLRTDGSEYSMESPLSLHRVVLHCAEAMRLIAPLASPISPAAFAAAWSPADRLALDVLEYLAAAGMVVAAQRPPGNPPVFAEDTDPAIIGWSPIDMMFHTRTTLGRHDHSFGLTYPTGNTGSAEPVIKPQAGQYIPLHRPDWEDLREADPPLTVAIEEPRSARRYGASPVTLARLGDLLYRAARVRSVITTAPGGQDLPGALGAGSEYSDRSYPSGGACDEVEFYVTVANCAGLPRGVYHYDPLGHRLEPVSADRAAVEELLGTACMVAAMDVPPQVLIGMTARFRRLSWKHEGLAYRLVLMHVGVLMQSLSLVCTAMGLAPCALGAVSIDAAARAFGTDWRVEPCVGQFLVGGETGPPGRETTLQRDFNDAQWADLARAYRR